LDHTTHRAGNRGAFVCMLDAMNVLVTGATGYIGGRLVPRLLEAGHAVPGRDSSSSDVRGK